MVDSAFGEYAEFTMHVPVVQVEEPAEDDDEPVGRAEIRERMSSQS